VCGRFTLTAAPARVAEHFGLHDVAGLRPRFNAAPGQEVAVVLGEGGRRTLGFRRWGLVPPWARDPAVGTRAINARVESAAERPAFRDALRLRRCLVPADGFYEWRRTRSGAEPHHVALEGGGLLAFAAIHERFEAGGAAPLHTCAILTCAARGRVRELHDRMPVIVSPEAYGAWLDPDLQDPERLRPLLCSELADRLGFRAVDARVNDPAFDEPGCLAPAAQLSLL
jgi:putative SOS response-associated peptidase YedK